MNFFCSQPMKNLPISKTTNRGAVTRRLQVSASEGHAIGRIPHNAEEIPGYDGDYLLTPGGTVYSTKWDGPRRMAEFDGRVCLWRNGQRYRPRISTLLERTFGEPEEAANDDDLAAYVDEQYGDDEEVQHWIQQNLATASEARG